MRGLLWCGLFCALLLMAGRQAQAAEPSLITLSCDGTVTDTGSQPMDRQPKPVEKMGVVANLNERTVSFMGFVAPIVNVDAASVNFNGEQIGPVAEIASKAGETVRIDGTLDRVTGHMVADAMTYEKKKLSDPSSPVTRDHYDVLCKATSRVF